MIFQIRQDDIFSKLLCNKCFNDTCVAYGLKKKCLDTDRTLKSLELKFETKLNEKVQEIIGQNEVKEEYFEEALRDDEEEFLKTEDVSSEEQEDVTEPENFVVYCEETEESFSAPAYVYEEVEYLETNEMQEENQLPEIEVEQWSEKSSLKKFRHFLCNLCKPNIFFKNKLGCDRHKYDVHQLGNNPLICSVCEYSFDGGDVKEDRLMRNIQKHMTAHKNGKLKSCMMCPEVYKSMHHLEEHHYRNHQNPSPQNKCKGCQNDFLTYEELKDHLLTTNCKDSHEKPFKCFICNETFVMGIAKKKHIQMLHQDRAGADCPLCLRCKIPSAVAFENHYKTHFEGIFSFSNELFLKINKTSLSEPRFCCSFCGRPFYESDRLQTHIRRAHETVKLSCNWCTKTFRDKSGIARHILGVHFNQRNHRCHFCSKAFTASYNLKEHMFSVHKQANKFYTCESCSQNFLYRKQYERHRVTCTGIPEKRRR